MNALFSDLCFPFPELQVGRDAFDGTSYYIFVSAFFYFRVKKSKAAELYRDNLKYF